MGEGFFSFRAAILVAFSTSAFATHNFPSSEVSSRTGNLPAISIPKSDTRTQGSCDSQLPLGHPWRHLPQLPGINGVDILRPLTLPSPFIDSAVVGIYREDGDLLMMQRGGEIGYGEWALAGGKLELGESLDGGARREIREEIRVEIGPLELLFVHYHSFAGSDRIFRVFVFGSKILPGQTPVIQEPEKILDLKWVAPSAYPRPLFSNFLEYEGLLSEYRRRLLSFH
jgi:8-oxo-dGTP diphosphatase